MSALLELALFALPGSAVKANLLNKWKNGVLALDTERDAWQLRADMARHYRNAIPGSEEAQLYEGVLRQLKGRDLIAERNAQTGMHLVAK
jgi:hypothetical protein